MMRTAHGVRPLPLVISLALALALLAVYTLGSTAGAPAAQPAPTIPAYLPMIVVAPTSIPAPPTATVPPGARPDLLIAGMAIELEHSGCRTPGAGLGVSVLVENGGLAPAGQFVVKINGQPALVGGLGPGERISAWVPGYVGNGQNVAIVDATNLVAESNEHNNQSSARLPIPTPPPSCPTFTPIPS